MKKMTQKLKGKSALVTGASRGIGQATAELFARHGATVIITARTVKDLRSVAGTIQKSGGKAIPIAGDITDEVFVKRLFEIIRQKSGRLDILVNNAGIYSFGPVQDFPVEKFRECLEVNIVGPFMCMQEAIRLMEKTGGKGKIVNIGSVRSHWTESGDCGAYNARKYGLRGLTESVARQLHGSGSRIAVGMVCPGVVNTPGILKCSPENSDFLSPVTVAEMVLHAVTAPENVNIFDTIFFPLAQKPW